MVKLKNKKVGNVVFVSYYSVRFLEEPLFFTGINYKTKYIFNINNEYFKSLRSRIVTIGPQFTGEDSFE